MDIEKIGEEVTEILEIIFTIAIIVLVVMGITKLIDFINKKEFIGKKENDRTENTKGENNRLEIKIKKWNNIIRNELLVIVSIIIMTIFAFLLIFPISQTADKPIIYLYPEEDTEVTVELGKSENITVSYPKYTTGWNVLAKTDGSLIDLSNNRSLYSLYYECDNTVKFQVTNEGFVVKGEEVAEFLEEKLEILGLNERESEEFIIYWLPVLQENEYNYIRFATYEEIEENMPLKITPNPDTVIRVLMTYKALDEPIEIEEQNLVTPERTGFVAVEWGGTEIK